MTKKITVPLINSNEPEASLVGVHVKNGDEVIEDQILFTIETTKSTADIAAEESGFVVGIKVSVGDSITAGTVIGFLAESPDWAPSEVELIPEGEKDGIYTPLPGNLKISQPAIKFAEEHGIDLHTLPKGEIITVAALEKLITQTPKGLQAQLLEEYPENSILVYGSGGHGKAVFDLLNQLGMYTIIGFVDDGQPAGTEVMGSPILGGREVLIALRERGVCQVVNAVGGIGNVSIRKKVFKVIMDAGFECPTVIHPTAFVEPSAGLSDGVNVFPYAYIGSEARVGFGTIVNTGSIVSHDCVLGDYVNISPGAILAGDVNIGNDSLVGMGVTINLRVKVGENAKIGNGATVKSDVGANTIVRAGTIWPE